MILNVFFGGGGGSAEGPFSVEVKTIGGNANVRACPQIWYYLELVIMFIDGCNPSKIFKLA